MDPAIHSVTVFASVITILADIYIVCVAFLILLSYGGDKIPKRLLRNLDTDILLTAFSMSVLGVLGSLFYSKVAGFAPCELCWWQRIFLFPQPIVYGIALWYRKSLKKNGKPNPEAEDVVMKVATGTGLLLSVIGAAIAVYHSYGQLFDPSVLPACEATGVSCAKLYFVEFGYVTLPTMSLTIFALLIVTLLIPVFGYKAKS